MPARVAIEIDHGNPTLGRVGKFIGVLARVCGKC
jgi:hypothetical protein